MTLTLTSAASAYRPTSLFFQTFCSWCNVADLGKPTKAELEKAIQGYILDETELISTYQR